MAASMSNDPTVWRLPSEPPGPFLPFGLQAQGNRPEDLLIWHGYVRDGVRLRSQSPMAIRPSIAVMINSAAMIAHSREPSPPSAVYKDLFNPFRPDRA